MPDILALVASSAASCCLSGAPVHGTDRRRAASVSSAMNTSSTRRSTRWADTQLDLVVAGTKDAVADGGVGKPRKLPERRKSCSGAVMFGHRHFPAGDPGDHRAGREGRQGAARAQGWSTTTRSRRKCSASSESDLRTAYAVADKDVRATRAVECRQGEGDGAITSPKARSRPTTSCASAPCSRSWKPKSSATTSLDNRQAQSTAGDLQDRAPDRVVKSASCRAAHGSALFTRGRDPGAGGCHARHRRRGRAVDRRAVRDVTKSRSCCTTTSLLIRWVRPAAWAAPSVARIGHGKARVGAPIHPILPARA